MVLPITLLTCFINCPVVLYMYMLVFMLGLDKVILLLQYKILLCKELEKKLKKLEN
jgi:hypothetical protein